MNILLTTPKEYAEIAKFVKMDLGTEATFKAIGEIISVPWEELVSPLYFQIDPRAPELRFIYPEDDGPEDSKVAKPSDPAPVDMTGFSRLPVEDRRRVLEVSRLQVELAMIALDREVLEEELKQLIDSK